MKKILAGLVIFGSLFAGNAQAQHYHGGGGYGGGRWIGPAIIGGVIGYSLSQPRYYYPYPPTVVVQQPPVIYTQPPIYTQPQTQQICELRSEVINGQVVQGQFCHN